MCARKINQDHQKYYCFSVQKAIHQKLKKLRKYVGPWVDKHLRWYKQLGLYHFILIYSTWPPTTHETLAPVTWPEFMNQGIRYWKSWINIFSVFPDAVLKPTHLFWVTIVILFWSGLKLNLLSQNTHVMLQLSILRQQVKEVCCAL